MSEIEKDLGNDAFKKKDYLKAVEHYTKSIELDPKNPMLYSNRSAAYFFLNNFHDSVQDAQKSIQIDSKFIKGYFRLAMALLKLKDFQNSIAILLKGLEIEPNNQTLKDTYKEILDKQKEYVELQKKRDNILRKSFTLRGQSRIDIETTNLYFDSLAKKIAKENGLDYYSIYKRINEIKKKDEENILILLKEYKNESAFIVSCILYQYGILDYAKLFIKQYLETSSKDQKAYIMLTLIDIYSGESRGENYARKTLQMDPNNLLAVKTYLEVFSNYQAKSIDEAEIILKDIQLILNGTSNILKGWLIEIGMKNWFFLMNNTRGALSQLKEIIDNSNQEGKENVKKIFNSHTSSVQPLVQSCLHPFHLLALQNSIIGRQDTENFFKRLRYGFIHIEPNEILDHNVPLICSLSLQSYMNDYCWDFDKEEENRLKELKERAESYLEKDFQGKWDADKEFQKLIILISLYEPLYKLKNMEKLTQINRKILNYIISLIIRYNINDYIEEMKNIKSDTEVTLKWKEIPLYIYKIPYHKELEWLYPSNYWPQGFDDLEKTKILITECGSGEDIYKYQVKYDKISVIGISSNERDVSYGKRQAKELGFNSDTLIYSSSLLYQPNIQFDVIEMDLRFEENPMGSIKNIISNLREGGVIKFEFYSRKFVDLIESAKKSLLENGISLSTPSFSEKHKARNLILKNSEFSQLTQRFQFFKLELFSQEIFSKNLNGISILEIERILNEYELSLISLVFPSGTFESYVKENQSDPKGKNLNLIEKFDLKNQIFKNFVKFYCEKPLKNINLSKNDDPLGAKSFLMKHLK